MDFKILLIGLAFFTFTSYGALTFSHKGEDAVLAFPEAEGFGKYTTGGREGKVLIVSNLNDSGKGSLREAIKQKFPRIIVFNISGTIELKSELKINHGDLTIAGQSAPGDGICLKNYPLKVSSSNVIIRYLRIRMGDLEQQQDDCISVLRQKDIIIDHCSFSWASDEVASCYDNENFTMQWCIISESMNHSVHEKGAHGYGGIWGGKGATFHHNLLAHHKSRLPRFCGARYHKSPENEVVDFRNNVVYNWKDNNSYAGEEGNHNIVGNYYKPGPATSTSKKGRILNPWSPYGKYYLEGNILDGNSTVTTDNWKGVVADAPDSARTDEPILVLDIETETAQDAYTHVLLHAGASLVRDIVDSRVLKNVKEGLAEFGFEHKGIIDSQTDVGGWPELKTYNFNTDTDKDGMPDKWEAKHDLDPKDNTDHALYSISKNYTNIEVYLNELIKKN
ncbi:pectate lyase [Flammeovirgaceae bacterium SG7u.111]|nr:pectate lyase [Flammeovirgaceae bacterium SG7u.132]WPO36298.1 pectate lyase [Flammeovirgaceae bacterium SG7u.111]